MKDDNSSLRALCRSYLMRLRYLAQKHGIGDWIDSAIKDTKDPNCKPTMHEVELLSRACDEERLKRQEIPPILGKNYKECFEDGDFEKIKTLKRVGIYSKVSAILFANKKKL